MKLSKKDANKIFGTKFSYNQLPLIYQLATKKDMNDFPVIRIVECDSYFTKKMPVYSFYKPIMKCITKR